MPGVELFLSLLQQASGQGARSTALNPLIWLVGMTLAALVSLSATHPPTWLMVSMAVLLFLVIVGFLVAYGYFAWTQPDALRSERFTLSKLALQQSLKGDDITGLRPTDGSAILALSPPPGSEPGETSNGE